MKLYVYSHQNFKEKKNKIVKQIYIYNFYNSNLQTKSKVHNYKNRVNLLKYIHKSFNYFLYLHAIHYKHFYLFTLTKKYFDYKYQPCINK